MAKGHLQNQKSVMMSELKIGDLIQTGTQFKNWLPHYPLLKINLQFFWVQFMCVKVVKVKIFLKIFQYTNISVQVLLY